MRDRSQTRCVLVQPQVATVPSCPKMRTEPKSRILEAFSKFAETSRRGTGSAIGAPEQTSPPDHPFRPTGAPELLCGGAVVIAGCLRCLLLVMCTHPFAKKPLRSI